MLMELERIEEKDVFRAMEEYRRLGRDEFLNRYNFGRAKSRWVVHQGRSYDAKAIVGVAHGYARRDLGPLSGGNPFYKTNNARRVLKLLKFQVTPNDSNPTIPGDAADDSQFDPSSVRDTREQTERAIYRRRGQKRFRDALLAAYDGQCVVTGCAVLDVLEAAHIHPYRGADTNKVDNGLLLRSDIHTLFDAGLISIDADSMKLLVAIELEDSEYGRLLGSRIRPPRRQDQQPSTKALQAHMKKFGWSGFKPR